MLVATTRDEARAARGRLGSVGLVPTMGYLHEGHLSLVRRAKAENDAVAVSIFVNPKQFGPNEDLASYPRDPERDLALLEKEGVDLVWTPTVEDVYPPGFATNVVVEGPAAKLEGAHRPGHFTGVATVVTILFGVLGPQRAYFGQKDAQQCRVVRQFVDDLALPVHIEVVPTFREADGLALSSRNVYLDDDQRAHATVLRRALQRAESAWQDGELDANLLRGRIAEIVAHEPLADLEYVSVADPDSLDELQELDPARGALASMAVRFGRTRLIDNVVLMPNGRAGGTLAG